MPFLCALLKMGVYGDLYVTVPSHSAGHQSWRVLHPWEFQFGFIEIEDKLHPWGLSLLPYHTLFFCFYMLLSSFVLVVVFVFFVAVVPLVLSFVLFCQRANCQDQRGKAATAKRHFRSATVRISHEFKTCPEPRSKSAPGC